MGGHAHTALHMSLASLIQPSPSLRHFLRESCEVPRPSLGPINSPRYDIHTSKLDPTPQVGPRKPEADRSSRTGRQRRGGGQHGLVHSTPVVSSFPSPSWFARCSPSMRTLQWISGTLTFFSRSVSYQQSILSLMTSHIFLEFLNSCFQPEHTARIRGTLNTDQGTSSAHPFPIGWGEEGGPGGSGVGRRPDRLYPRGATQSHPSPLAGGGRMRGGEMGQMISQRCNPVFLLLPQGTQMS